MSRETLQAVAEAHGVALVLQFGSSVNGTSHAGSDLDLGILFTEMPRLEDELSLLADLQVLYPDSEVDLTVINRADPLLLKQVVTNSRLLFGDSRRFAELQILAFRKYQDHRRYLDLESDYVRRVNMERTSS